MDDALVAEVEDDVDEPGFGSACRFEIVGEVGGEKLLVRVGMPNINFPSQSVEQLNANAQTRLSRRRIVLTYVSQEPDLSSNPDVV